MSSRGGISGYPGGSLRGPGKSLSFSSCVNASGADIPLLGEIGGRELQAVEEQPGGLVIDGVGDDAAHDLIDADLDGRRVLSEGNEQASIAGNAIRFVDEVVKMTEFLVTHGRLPALFVVELHVHALRCAEVRCPVLWFVVIPHRSRLFLISKRYSYITYNCLNR